jgi:hypothetical protein
MLVELDVSDLAASVVFYGLLGFTVAFERRERRFAFLTRDGCVDVMLQQSDGPGERLLTAPLEHRSVSPHKSPRTCAVTQKRCRAVSARPGTRCS